jgi:hypothetical protein
MPVTGVLQNTGAAICPATSIVFPSPAPLGEVHNF